MRIGLSTSVVQRGKTGVAQYVFGLIHAFLASGVERHTFVLFVLEADLPLFAFARDAMEIVPVDEKFRPPLRNIQWHQTQLPRLARALRLDVLHVPSYRRMLWPRPCALVATIHDLAPFRVAAKYDKLRMFYGRVVARVLAGRQHELIAVSATTAVDLRRYFRVPEARLNIVLNGIDHNRFYPGSRPAAKAWAAAKHRLHEPFFLYVARLEYPGKNHLRLIEAFDRFKAETSSRWQLALAGADWHGADEIHAARARARFGADIQCLGFVPDGDLPSLYRAASAFVYPSLHEGFGLPPIEAMACGCPAICSPRGALAEVVGDAAIIADPLDVGAWAQALARLGSDERERERWRAAGLRHAARFDWNIAARETMSVYERAHARLHRPSQVTAVGHLSPSTGR